MINLFKVFSPIVFVCLVVAPLRSRGQSEEALPSEFPPTSLVGIKTLFAAKRVDEAIKILREQHKQILRDDSSRRELSRWLSSFLFDDTMAIHEKALGLEEQKPDEAVAEFKKALAAEPYNKVLITHYLSFLIGSDQWRQAQEFAESKWSEQPYMSLYKIYATHAKALLGEKVELPSCDARDLMEVEAKYCYLVQLIVKVSAADPKTPVDSTTIKLLVKRSKLPDANYWAWKARGDREELKKYVSLCQSLSPKDKKNYKIVPGVCNKLEDALEKLKTVAQWYFPAKKFSFVL
jgi:tetratricopeptide (TPR) repeat protein